MNWVSMPSNGQPSFLRDVWAVERAFLYLCQCPLTGNHHFYFPCTCQCQVHGIWCQCPLTGNHHFYDSRQQRTTYIWRCQCPLTGNHHFYEVKRLSSEKREEVSMPSNGQPSFLPKHRRSFVRTVIMGVSMPSNGQPSFLPYPSKFIDFMRLPSLNFGGIFLNIQITADCPLLFWLFTICSYLSSDF